MKWCRLNILYNKKKRQCMQHDNQERSDIYKKLANIAYNKFYFWLNEHNKQMHKYLNRKTKENENESSR